MIVLSFFKFFLVAFFAIFFAFILVYDHYKSDHFYHKALYILQIFISILCASAVAIILVLLDHFFIGDSINSYVLLTVVFIITFLISFYLIKEPSPLNHEKELKKREKQLSNFFEKYTPILPDKDICDNDIKNIREKLSSLFLKFRFGDNDVLPEEDIQHFQKLIKFFGLRTKVPQTQISINSDIYNWLLYASKSIDVQFVTYSPDFKYFVCYYSFKYSEGGLVKSSAIFGERENDALHLYAYNTLFKYFFKATEAQFEFFTGWDDAKPIIYNFERLSLTRKHKYPKYNPLQALFWKDPNFFSAVKIDDREYLRFKTYNFIVPKLIEIPYQLREKVVLPY